MSTYLCVRCNAGVLQLQSDVSTAECLSVLPNLVEARSLEERLLLTAAQVLGDAPLCEVCMQSGISEMSREVETLRQELQLARQTLGELGPSENVGIATLQDELEELTSTLASLAVREAKLENKLAELTEEERKLKETSDDVFGQWLEVQENAMISDSVNLGVEKKIKNLREDLKTLKKTNVVDLVFKISVQGEIGLINGLRLGKLTNKFPTPWTEINAALGQVALLIQYVQSQTTTYTNTYRLVPKGSLSYLVDENNKTHDLFFTSASNSRKFDHAMQALLVVVHELLVHCIRANRNLRVPYKIELPEKIGNSKDQLVSVNFQFHGEVQWTQAMKFLLTNLKFLLLHILQQNP